MCQPLPCSILLDLLGPVRTMTKIEYGVCKKFENFCDHQTSFVLICNRVCIDLRHTRNSSCNQKPCRNLLDTATFRNVCPLKV